MRAQNEIRRTESRLCRGHAGDRQWSRGPGPPRWHHPRLTHLELQSPTQTPELPPQGPAEKLGDGAVGGQAPPGGASTPGGTLAWELALSPAGGAQGAHQNDPGGGPLAPGPRSEPPGSGSQRCPCGCAEGCPGRTRPGCGYCEPRDPRQLSAACVHLQMLRVLSDARLAHSQFTLKARQSFYSTDRRRAGSGRRGAGRLARAGRAGPAGQPLLTTGQRSPSTEGESPSGGAAPHARAAQTPTAAFCLQRLSKALRSRSGVYISVLSI